MNTSKLLVVLYKTAPNSSPTIQSIIDFYSGKDIAFCKMDEMIIWDNSPESQSDSIKLLRTSCPIQIRYISTPENTSLSKIYNTIARELDEDEYLTLLDQDSFLSKEYFIELREAQSSGQQLILPRVKCGGLLVSPGTRFFCKGKLRKDINPGLTPSKNLLAINSGMSAKGSVFKKIPYDERLMFYGTDTYFMKHYEKHFSYVYVLSATLNHSLAESDEATSIERKQQIAQTRRAAWQIVFSETLAERLFLHIYEFALRLRSWVRS